MASRSHLPGSVPRAAVCGLWTSGRRAEADIPKMLSPPARVELEDPHGAFHMTTLKSKQEQRPLSERVPTTPPDPMETDANMEAHACVSDSKIKARRTDDARFTTSPVAADSADSGEGNEQPTPWGRQRTFGCMLPNEHRSIDRVRVRDCDIPLSP